MKTKRYTLKALPERTVVMIPLVGTRTLLSQVLGAVRNERIPRSAKLRIVTRHDGTRSLRAEFTTTD